MIRCDECYYYSTARGIRCNFTGEWNPRKTKCENFTSKNDWDRHLVKALMLVRELRLKAVQQDLDTRAVRVALKYALLIDDELSREHGIRKEEERKINLVAQDLFKKTPRGLRR